MMPPSVSSRGENAVGTKTPWVEITGSTIRTRRAYLPLLAPAATVIVYYCCTVYLVEKMAPVLPWANGRITSSDTKMMNVYVSRCSTLRTKKGENYTEHFEVGGR